MSRVNLFSPIKNEFEFNGLAPSVQARMVSSWGGGSRRSWEKFFQVKRTQGDLAALGYLWEQQAHFADPEKLKAFIFSSLQDLPLSERTAFHDQYLQMGLWHNQSYAERFSRLLKDFGQQVFEPSALAAFFLGTSVFRYTSLKISRRLAKMPSCFLTGAFGARALTYSGALTAEALTFSTISSLPYFLEKGSYSREQHWFNFKTAFLSLSLMRSSFSLGQFLVPRGKNLFAFTLSWASLSIAHQVQSALFWLPKESSGQVWLDTLSAQTQFFLGLSLAKHFIPRSTFPVYDSSLKSELLFEAPSLARLPNAFSYPEALANQVHMSVRWLGGGRALGDTSRLHSTKIPGANRAVRLYLKLQNASHKDEAPEALRLTEEDQAHLKRLRGVRVVFIPGLGNVMPGRLVRQEATRLTGKSPILISTAVGHSRLRSRLHHHIIGPEDIVVQGNWVLEAELIFTRILAALENPKLALAQEEKILIKVHSKGGHHAFSLGVFRSFYDSSYRCFPQRIYEVFPWLSKFNSRQIETVMTFLAKAKLLSIGSPHEDVPLPKWLIRLDRALLGGLSHFFSRDFLTPLYEKLGVSPIEVLDAIVETRLGSLKMAERSHLPLFSGLSHTLRVMDLVTKSGGDGLVPALKDRHEHHAVFDNVGHWEQIGDVHFMRKVFAHAGQLF